MVTAQEAEAHPGIQTDTHSEYRIDEVGSERCNRERERYNRER